MKRYNPSEVEQKWRAKWEETKLYHTDLNDYKNKYYVLVELSYTSGDLHMGHWFTYAMGDVLARAKRFQGYNVLLPNGFDAFGLPAENAAIKKGIHPRDWTYANVDRMKKQFSTMGGSFDWEKSAITADPEYYKWNQWIFLKMLEKGLAYKGKLLSNWCSSCKTVLANENVESGKCWRCGTEVEQKEVEQWFFKITDYADKLLWPDNPSIDWPKPLRDGQNSWIGKSAGVLIKFKLETGEEIEVFTTRPDTIYGATFLVISPEHPLVSQILEPGLTKQIGEEHSRQDQLKEYVNQAKKKSELERKENKDKTGVFSGVDATNPMTGESIPVWVADYVLPGYGTGAIMAVPGHDSRDFEFAQKFNLEVKSVILPENEAAELEPEDPYSESSVTVKPDSLGYYEGQGVMVNSGPYDGLLSQDAWKKISDHIVANHLGSLQTQYHLHDWSFSRQRYWGTPIPIIYCDNCGTVPVPESDLPVELPYEVDYAPLGKAPLATNEKWLKVKCPKCEGEAQREVETMDTFVDSSWYFFRYLDPKNDQEIFDKEIVKYWGPVDIYFGGPEHTLGHALYSRFFTKFFKDIGLIDFDEYANKRVHHGIILGPDGSRMSKSKGNIVNPDDQVRDFGADAVRTYLAFLGPFDIVTPWNPQGIHGVYHFLERVWGLFDKVEKSDSRLAPEDLKMMHKAIKRVASDIGNIKFNTAVAALMEWLNYLSKKESIKKSEYQTFLLLLAPFAPHMTEELWSLFGQQYSIHKQLWPEFNEKFLESDEIKIVISIDGKVRGEIMIDKDLVNDQIEIENRAKKSEKIDKYLRENEVSRTVHVPGKMINFVLRNSSK